ncbi:MAG: MarC family protein [Hyphomicrobium sp.]|jgi:multiple antibiotic resistance protein
MLAVLLTSFTTFFATVGPIEAAVLFATLTPHVTATERRGIAVRATLIASGILLVSTIAGGPLLRQLGVTLAALKAAGGIILLLIALDMVFARPTSAFKLTPPEGAEAEAKDKEDLAVFPLATPLLAGPGAMSAGILLAANAHGDPLQLAVTVLALVLVMVLTVALLLIGHELSHMLGITAQRVLMRVFGILLAAIAMQALFNGLLGSGLLPPHVGS